MPDDGAGRTENCNISRNLKYITMLENKQNWINNNDECTNKRETMRENG